MQQNVSLARSRSPLALQNERDDHTHTHHEQREREFIYSTVSYCSLSGKGIQRVIDCGAIFF